MTLRLKNEKFPNCSFWLTPFSQSILLQQKLAFREETNIVKGVKPSTRAQFPIIKHMR